MGWRGQHGVCFDAQWVSVLPRRYGIGAYFILRACAESVRDLWGRRLSILGRDWCGKRSLREGMKAVATPSYRHGWYCISTDVSGRRARGQKVLILQEVCFENQEKNVHINIFSLGGRMHAVWHSEAFFEIRAVFMSSHVLSSHVHLFASRVFGEKPALLLWLFLRTPQVLLFHFIHHALSFVVQ